MIAEDTLFYFLGLLWTWGLAFEFEKLLCVIPRPCDTTLFVAYVRVFFTYPRAFLKGGTGADCFPSSETLKVSRLARAASMAFLAFAVLRPMLWGYF
jgi:hypothetical protein